MTERLIKLFIKHPERVTDTRVRAAYGILGGAVGIVCNLILFLVKLLTGVLAHSLSITADAFNNLSDTASSVASLIGFTVAAKPPDEEHPYGHARFEYLSGLVVAALVLVVGVQFLITSVKKILHPASIEAEAWMLALLIITMLVKVALCRFYTGLGNRISSASLKATGRDSLNDVVTTAVVLVAVFTERVTGLKIDGYMGLVVSLWILYGCIGIVHETVSPLIGESADPELVKCIAEKIRTYDTRVLGIHDLMVHDYGPGRRFATVHMEIDAREEVLKTHDMIDDIEHMIMREEGIELLIHHDPIVLDDPEQNHLWRMTKKVLRQMDDGLHMHDFRVHMEGTPATVSFDVVMPPDCKVTEQEVRKRLQEVLDREERKYTLDITFDTQSFNRYLRE